MTAPDLAASYRALGLTDLEIAGALRAQGCLRTDDRHPEAVREGLRAAALVQPTQREQTT